MNAQTTPGNASRSKLISETRAQLGLGDGQAGDGDGARLRVIDPATGATIGELAAAGEREVDAAVRAAREALDGPWGRLQLTERARLLRRIAEQIEGQAERLARIESIDTGKPIAQTLPRVHAASGWFEFFADMAQKTRSSVIPGPRGMLTYTLRQPIGVVGAIIPWNYPITSCAVKVPAALAMGNCVVLKPAEDAPLLPLALHDLCLEAGLPRGVFGVVAGEGPVAGTAIVEHPGVGMVSFTGSTAVGRELAQRAARRLIPVSLELGGKSPNVVFADADLDRAAATSLFTFAQNQGQNCTAGTRLLVEASVHDEFMERLISRARELRLGDPLDAGTQLGAVISERQLARIERYVEHGRTSSATMVIGSGRPSVPGLENGFFYTPTVFTDVGPDAKIAQEEIFGPVLSVLRFEDEAEAVRLANDVVYGLAAAVWTSDLGRAHRLAETIDAGVVWLNTMHVLSPGAPFGGWKESGLGVMGGEEQAIDFSREKAVWVNTGAEAPGFDG